MPFPCYLYPFEPQDDKLPIAAHRQSAFIRQTNGLKRAETQLQRAENHWAFDTRAMRKARMPIVSPFDRRFPCCLCQKYPKACALPGNAARRGGPCTE
jgi:hypothetical protein